MRMCMCVFVCLPRTLRCLSRSVNLYQDTAGFFLATAMSRGRGWRREQNGWQVRVARSTIWLPGQTIRPRMTPRSTRANSSTCWADSSGLCSHQPVPFEDSLKVKEVCQSRGRERRKEPNKWLKFCLHPTPIKSDFLKRNTTCLVKETGSDGLSWKPYKRIRRRR